ncbi:MAG TPA: hypothetical protein VL633_04265 [Bacteroidota bacterium]|nr:hypothetical protein [Bacteroidota bacterium]
MEKKDLTWLGGILFVSLICLSPILSGDFINRDDPAYITGNELIQDFSFSGIARIVATPHYEGDYHPLTLSFFAIEHHFFDNHPGGYHAVSIVLHLAALTMIFIFVKELTGFTMIAGIVSLLFGIHPLQVESVAWISQQKDMLYVYFLLGSLLWYLRYVRSENNPRVFYWLAFALFLVALLSKTMAVSLPLLLLLVDYYALRKFSATTLMEKLPFFILALGFGFWSIRAHQAAGTYADAPVYSITERLLLASIALVKYIQKIFVPIDLAAYYPYPFAPGQATASMMMYPFILLLIVLLAFLTFRKSRSIAFGLGFFFVATASVSQMFPLAGAFTADRYTYLSSAGIFFLLGSGACYLAVKFDNQRRAKKLIVFASLAIVTLTLGIATWSRANVWNNSVGLWSDVIKKYPGVPFVYVYRANARPLPQELNQSLADFDKAISLRQDLGIAYFSRAYVYSLAGNHAAAVADYSAAIQLNYDLHHAYSNRASSYATLGDIGHAMADFARAVQTSPNDPDPYFNRANVELRLGQFQPAISDLDKVLELNRQDTVSLYNRAIAKRMSGDLSGSCSDLRTASGMDFAPAISAYNTYCR